MDARRRLLRAVKWAAVAAAGIILGLLFGARGADVSPDIGMLFGIGMVAGGLALVAGLAWPLPTMSAPVDPSTAEIDLRDPVLDLRVEASEPEPARRPRPLRPRTPPG